MGLEGIVSKRRRNPYRNGGKDEARVKIKCWDIGEFELLGAQRQAGKRSAARKGRQVVGKALKRAQQGKASPAGLPTAVVTPDVEWVRPGINMRVKTLRGEPTLRQCLDEGFREE
jgi:ATP-dependent DNA ligase